MFFSNSSESFECQHDCLSCISEISEFLNALITSFAVCFHIVLEWLQMQYIQFKACLSWFADCSKQDNQFNYQYLLDADCALDEQYRLWVFGCVSDWHFHIEEIFSICHNSNVHHIIYQTWWFSSDISLANVLLNWNCKIISWSAH